MREIAAICRIVICTLEAWVFGEGVDSARGVAAIVLCRRNSSCNSSCDAIARNGRRTIALFCCFECKSLFAIGRVKGCSKHASNVAVAAKYCNLTPCRFHPFSKHPTFHQIETPTSDAKNWQGRVSRQGSQDTVYPLRELRWTRFTPLEST